MALPEPKNIRFTYEDYLSWEGPERFELIEGIPYAMASPSPKHQTIVGQLHAFLWLYFASELNTCQPFASPIDIRLDLNKHLIQWFSQTWL
jgi:Uma2 family endonuclease